MIDTNTVSYLVKGQSRNARARIEELGEKDSVCISSITEAEIWYGLAKQPVSAETRAAIKLFLQSIDVISWDSAAAASYGVMRAKLEASGKTLGAMDMLIAAHAAATDAVLVTSDRAFQNTDGLFATVNWADDLAEA
jgi:tRNA(fMet)-specific endonuclease VapC